jgi:hypothetical protein
VNALLKPITARCITRPVLNNQSIKCFGVWMQANIVALKEYYVATGHDLPNPRKDGHLKADGDAHRFMTFCQIQWDRKRGVL